ncbi:MAG: hypothetical protein GXY83_03710 [Rhodopirellula sp.]|nr:hypothetical protein [Rhodopirellula sp.]
MGRVAPVIAHPGRPGRRPSTIRGITHCFNGQLVYLVSGTRRNVVTSFAPVVGSIDRERPAESQYAFLQHGARYVLALGIQRWLQQSLRDKVWMSYNRTAGKPRPGC